MILYLTTVQIVPEADSERRRGRGRVERVRGVSAAPETEEKSEQTQ